MTSFALARARIGSARVLLQNLRGETLLAASRLQSHALIDLLRGKEIDSQRRAVLSDQIFNVNFVEEHRNAILATLAGRPKMKRRDSQDAMHAFEYFAAAEWQRLDAFKNNQAAIEGLVLDVVVLRMQVINPTEPTVKLLASAILCLIYGQDACDISLLEKIEMKNTVAKRIKARVRKVGHHVVEYCEEYPALPDKLAATHPALYERLKVDGGFTPSRLSQSLLQRVEASYNCRGSLAQQQGKCVALPETPSVQMQMMQMMSMMQMLQRGDDQGKNKNKNKNQNKNKNNNNC